MQTLFELFLLCCRHFLNLADTFWAEKKIKKGGKKKERGKKGKRKEKKEKKSAERKKKAGFFFVMDIFCPMCLQHLKKWLKTIFFGNC